MKYFSEARLGLWPKQNAFTVCSTTCFTLHALFVPHTSADLQHSSLTTHFSVSSVLSWHSEPSSGYCLTYRSLDLMPIPQDTLQADQLIHSDIMHVDASVGEETAEQKAPLGHERLPPGSLLATRSLILSATNTATSSKQIENKYIKRISTWQFKFLMSEKEMRLGWMLVIWIGGQGGPHKDQPLQMDHLGGGEEQSGALRLSGLQLMLQFLSYPPWYLTFYMAIIGHYSIVP